MIVTDLVFENRGYHEKKTWISLIGGTCGGVENILYMNNIGYGKIISRRTEEILKGC